MYYAFKVGNEMQSALGQAMANSGNGHFLVTGLVGGVCACVDGAKSVVPKYSAGNAFREKKGIFEARMGAHMVIVQTLPQ